MDRDAIVRRIGYEYRTSNIEAGEYSYVQEAGSMEKLVSLLGHKPKHFKLDIRFEKDNVAVLVETKQKFTTKDEAQLKEYCDEEKALHPDKQIICILANTSDDKIRVWKSSIDADHHLLDETVLDTMEHYQSLFTVKVQNNREAVLKNTYILNETLHKKDIDEKLRSQFVGTTILYIKDVLKKHGITTIDDKAKAQLKTYWSSLSAKQICTGIEETLTKLLDGSDNKAQKVELLQRSVLNNQKVKKLHLEDWIAILIEIVDNIYKYINTDSSEGQDILNLFFIAFNKYTGKSDKNQAFTPDHITNFMCRVTGVDHSKRIFDGTCGSGSFLVQAMVLEFADCDRQKATEKQKKELKAVVAQNHIFGIEIEDKAYGLSTTNMLIHGDGNSNIKQANLFESEDFIRFANPDIILMNPPYNAKPITIPKAYKTDWKPDAKEDPTKGFVFIKFISDVVSKINNERLSSGLPKKEIKVAVLLPVAAAIGASSYIADMKRAILEENTLEAVFSLPNEIFYPGASASACCMIFTFGKAHRNTDGTINNTFFGYYKEDGHKKKKNLGRIEQFDTNNQSIWKRIEEEWLNLYRNKIVKDGLSALHIVSGDDEWLCEAYMKTDYSQLRIGNFIVARNKYLAYLIANGSFGEFEAFRAKTMLPGIKLDITNWKEFRISNLFNVELSKGDIKEDEVDAGNIPLVSSGENNNGIVKHITAAGDGKAMIFSGNKITLDMFGNAYYQAEPFYAVSHGRVNILSSKFILNQYIGLFVTSIIKREQFKYSYGRAVYSSVAENMIIKLPIKYNSDGSVFIDETHKYSDEGYVPDWEFMENYIKALPYGDRLD